jgi:hypothetical protein
MRPGPADGCHPLYSATNDGEVEDEGELLGHLFLEPMELDSTNMLPDSRSS